MITMLQNSPTYFISYFASKPLREAVWEWENLKAKVIVITAILHCYVEVINLKLQCDTGVEMSL